MAALPRPPVCTEDTARNHRIVRPRRGSPKPPFRNGLDLEPFRAFCHRTMSRVRSPPHYHSGAARYHQSVACQCISRGRRVGRFRPPQTKHGMVIWISLPLSCVPSANTSIINPSNRPGRRPMIMQRVQQWKSAKLAQVADAAAPRHGRRRAGRRGARFRIVACGHGADGLGADGRWTGAALDHAGGQ